MAVLLDFVKAPLNRFEYDEVCGCPHEEYKRSDDDNPNETNPRDHGNNQSVKKDYEDR
jgi:hypothetical protein